MSKIVTKFCSVQVFFEANDIDIPNTYETIVWISKFESFGLYTKKKQAVKFQGRKIH